jgi:elongation factor P--beta-lysine ligase
LEIELPVLSPSLVPESYLDIFETEYQYISNKQKLYLTPSPELFLKRLLVKGIGNCFYLGKSFRNSELPSRLHSFEFVMLEFYKMNADYFDIAQEILKMMRYIAKKTFNKTEIIFHGKKVSFKKWEKITVSQAFRKFAKISENELFDSKLFIYKATKKGYVTDGFSYEDIFSQIYCQEIEPKLGMNGYPTLIYNYPKEFAALAKLNKNQKTAQRFEFYIGGIELGDCYSELTDWKEQEVRFDNEEILRNKHGKTKHPIDKGFIKALQYGLNDCAGVAIGFERLAMIFTDSDSINKIKLINIT